jgi:23S rRNA G2069 N7-methylase RlmK/C1962 C5-methylase RlmI
MIVHIDVGVVKKDGKWIGRWTPQSKTKINEVFDEEPSTHEITANRREELERKLDKALRLAFPTANYIVQHREIDQQPAVDLDEKCVI